MPNSSAGAQATAGATALTVETTSAAVVEEGPLVAGITAKDEVGVWGQGTTEAVAEAEGATASIGGGE